MMHLHDGSEAELMDEGMNRHADEEIYKKACIDG